MPEVHIPAMLREWTGGHSTVEAAGATVRQVIEDLERRWPGIRDRLIEGDRLRSNLSVAVDGEIGPLGLREAVEPSSEVHFVAAIKGGSPGGAGHLACRKSPASKVVPQFRPDEARRLGRGRRPQVE